MHLNYWKYPRICVLLFVHVNLYFCTYFGPEVTHFEMWIVKSLVATFFYEKLVLQHFVLIVGRNVVFIKNLQQRNFLWTRVNLFQHKLHHKNRDHDHVFEDDIKQVVNMWCPLGLCKISNFKLKTCPFVFRKKVNFKAGLFSLTFLFERSFCFPWAL